MPFFFTLLPPFLPFLKVGSTGLLCEKVKQHPVQYNKQIKVYREKDVVRNMWNAGVKYLEFIENCKCEMILFFMLCLG